MELMVRALKMGYYNHSRKREGVKFMMKADAFKLKKENGKDVLVLPSWVEPIKKVNLQSAAEIYKKHLASSAAAKAQAKELEAAEIEEQDEESDEEKKPARSGPASQKDVI